MSFRTLIHPLSSSPVSTYYEPYTGLGTGNKAVGKTNEEFGLWYYGLLYSYHLVIKQFGLLAKFWLFDTEFSFVLFPNETEDWVQFGSF